MRIIKNLVLAIIFSIVFVFGSSDVLAENGNLTIEPYVFENSKKEKVNAEFGRLKVPENRKKKNGKMIELAFVRFKSTSKNPGSPIVYLAGGPGGSGIGTARGTRFPLFMTMREFGDVIAFDQRGTGSSKPNLRCKERIDLPFDKPLSREAVIKESSEKIKLCEKAWKERGVDPSAYNTVESADDINDLRKALGAKKVSLWGISYGTHLSLATLRRHGKYIDKAILAGIEGVDDTYKLPSYTQDLMVDLDKRLKTDKNLSNKIPNLLGLIEKVHKKLEANPVTVEVTNPRTKQKFNITLGKYDIQFLLSAFSGSNEAQALMPKLYYDMANGNFTLLAQQMAGFRKRSVNSLMSVAMDCASGISKKRTARIQKEKQTTLFSNAINDPYPEICSSIENANLSNKFRKPVKSKVPTLFISGTLDGRTPVSNAEIAKKGFKNSTHLIIDGAGHSDPLFLSSPKIKDTMLEFMKGKDLPSEINIEMSKPFRFLPISK